MKKKISYKIFFVFMGLVFALLLLLMFLMNVISPTHSFSEKENRVLTQRPAPSVSRIVSGKYEKDYESYVNDQFIFRDLWITVKAGTDRLLGKNESNGVYLGKKSYLMEAFHTPDESQQDATLSAMASFAKKHSDLKQFALIAPTSVSTLKQYLPANAPVDDQSAYLDELSSFFDQNGISFVDVRNVLKDNIKEGLYYHTDHHWTTQGAYYAFTILGKSLALDTDKYTYKSSPASYHFQGMLSAKTGFLSNKQEELDVFLPEDADNYPESVINYVEEQTKSASFYDVQSLEGRDKYSVFFGGNHAEVKITTNTDSDDTLLIFKDSYANCLVPFLAPYYKKIVMIDPRYYFGDIENLIEAEGVSQILYLYNANTFSEDTSLNITLSEE